MKRILRFMVPVAILAITSWISFGAESPVYGASCPGGYPSCVLLAGRPCSTGTPCCDGSDEGFCFCSSGRYLCAV